MEAISGDILWSKAYEFLVDDDEDLKMMGAKLSLSESQRRCVYLSKQKKIGINNSNNNDHCVNPELRSSNVISL